MVSFEVSCLSLRWGRLTACQSSRDTKRPGKFWILPPRRWGWRMLLCIDKVDQPSQFVWDTEFPRLSAKTSKVLANLLGPQSSACSLRASQMPQSLLWAKESSPHLFNV